ncbi:uncharacterized protein [Triticum aestivum]|uniref:uncharacterized protein isoform X2 n=1 Tax=Triticum aestivum TaxID=4565 RepID=UPI001D032411|nr:uncharacterized protein LOC123044185 isoform X2 [Triticum aestivum]
MVEPRAGAAEAPSLAATDALPAPNQGTTAGARKRKAPATEKAPRKPRKRQVEEPIQIPVYYGCRKGDFSSVHGDDLVQDCPAIYAENICAHIIGELPLQPQSMSLVDLQLWVFKLFRLHPETQDLRIKGFLKQHKNDPYDEEDPDWYLEYYRWDTHEFYGDKYWSSFANKLKKKRNVAQIRRSSCCTWNPLRSGTMTYCSKP